MAFETHRNWKPRNFGWYKDGTKVEDCTLEDEDVTPIEDVQKMLDILDAANMEYIIEAETSHIDDENPPYHTICVRADVICIEVPATRERKYPSKVHLQYCPPYDFGPYRWVLYSGGSIDFRKLLKFIQNFPVFIDHLAAGESNE